MRAELFEDDGGFDCAGALVGKQHLEDAHLGERAPRPGFRRCALACANVGKREVLLTAGPDRVAKCNLLFVEAEVHACADTPVLENI